VLLKQLADWLKLCDRVY